MTVRKLRKKPVWVPKVLKKGSRSTVVRVWTFLLLNQPYWFTAKEISGHLDLSLPTIQKALKKLRDSHNIPCEDKRPYRGRPEKKYRFSERELGFY